MADTCPHCQAPVTDGLYHNDALIAETALRVKAEQALATEKTGNHTMMYSAAIQAVRGLCKRVGAESAFIDDCVRLAIATAYRKGKAGEPLEVRE